MWWRVSTAPADARNPRICINASGKPMSVQYTDRNGISVAPGFDLNSSTVTSVQISANRTSATIHLKGNNADAQGAVNLVKTVYK